MEQGKINIDFNSSALGDTIGFLPVLKYLQDRNMIEKVYVLDYLQELFTFVLRPEQIIVKKDGDQYVSKWPFLMSWVPKPTNLHMHFVDYGSIVLADRILDMEDKNYPNVNVDDVPNLVSSDNYVVLTYGSTYSNKKIPAKTIEGIINYFKYKGIEVVLLGKNMVLSHNGGEIKIHFDDIDTDGCINLIDKTTLKQAVRIIRGAKCIVGVDNGLIHLAGLTDTPIVVGYSLRHPKYSLPIRHNELGWNCYVVEPDDKCRYCMTDWVLPVNADFRHCDNESFLCVKSLTVEKFIKKIEEVLR